MKRPLSALLIAGTLLTAAVGFLLPGFLCSAQDKTLQNRVNICETAGISFHPVSQLEDSFLLLENGSSFDAPKNAHTKLDADGAYLAVRKMLQTVSSLPAVNYSSHKETLYLLVSADNLRSALVWKCVLSDKNSTFFVLIDDNSGEMLAFRQYYYSQNQNIFSDDYYDCQPLAKGMAVCCAAYYGWQMEDFKPEYGQTAENGAVESGAAETYFYFSGEAALKSSSGREIKVSVELTRNSCTFGNTTVFQKICS